MAAYWKGYNKKNITRVVGVFYDEIKKDIFTNDTIGRVVNLSDGSNVSIIDDKAVAENYAVERQISEEEYSLLCDLSHLSTEIFLNQYTGGFPSETKAHCLLNRIRSAVPEVIKIQIGGDTDG